MPPPLPPPVPLAYSSPLPKPPGRPVRLIVGGIVAVVFGLIGAVGNPISAVSVWSMPIAVPAVPPGPTPQAPPIAPVTPVTGEVVGPTGMNESDRNAVWLYVNGKAAGDISLFRADFLDALGERGYEVIPLKADDLTEVSLSKAIQLTTRRDGFEIKTASGTMTVDQTGATFVPAAGGRPWRVHNSWYTDESGKTLVDFSHIQRQLRMATMNSEGRVPTPVQLGAVAAQIRKMDPKGLKGPLLVRPGTSPGPRTMMFDISGRRFYVRDDGRTALDPGPDIDLESLVPKPAPGVPASAGLSRPVWVVMLGEAVISTALSVILILAGYRLITASPSAGRWTLAYAIPAIAMSLLAFAVSLAAGDQMLAAMKLPMQVPPWLTVVINLVGLCFSLSLPLFMTWVVQSRAGKNHLGVGVRQMNRT